MSNRPNVVYGYTSYSYLLLDSDKLAESIVVNYCEECTKFHKLGSVLIMKTSGSAQVDLEGNKLGNFCSVFGKQLSWEEIVWLIGEAYRNGIVDDNFMRMRFYGKITERINAKNFKKSHPVIHRYIANGINDGCMDYLETWMWNKKVGF